MGPRVHEDDDQSGALAFFSKLLKSNDIAWTKMNPFALSSSKGKTSATYALRQAQGERVGANLESAVMSSENASQNFNQAHLNVITH
jgi:hypothetical protein